MTNGILGLSANNTRKFITMFAVYIVFLALSFFYTPYINSVDSHESIFSEELFVEQYFQIEKNDSSALSKALTYGIEEYTRFIDYLVYGFTPTEESNDLQAIIWLVASCWIFAGFQLIIDKAGLDTDYDTDNKVLMKIARFLYSFFVENAMGYLALICLYFSGVLMKSKFFAHFTSFVLSLSGPIKHWITELNLEFILFIILIVVVVNFGLIIFYLIFGPIQFILIQILTYYIFLLIIAFMLYLLGERYPSILELFGGHIPLITVTVYTVLWKTHQKEFVSLLLTIITGESVEL